MTRTTAVRVGAMLLCAVLLASGLTGLTPSGVGGSRPAAALPAEPLRLNQFQALGTHNSYHIEPPPEMIDVFTLFEPTAYQLAYTHDPLAEQFQEQGVRQIELDVYADPDGTGVYPPVGVPGWKVAHIEQIDMGSHCSLLVDCLEQVKDWSDLNGAHIPLMILLEIKDTNDIPDSVVPVPVDAALLHDLDATIRSVFPDDRLVTPDFVRGVDRPGGADGEGTVYPDPQSAVTDYGWPLLDDTRGRVLFTLDNKRDEYVDGDPTLAGRAAFPPSSPGNPDAAFIKRNDPEGANLAEIQALVAAGYVVRTRGDLPVDTGLSGSDAQLQAALASGAQWVSGDYPEPDDHARYDAAFAARYGLPFDPARPAYQTVIPGGTPARCNPVNAPAGCTSSDVEDLAARAADPLDPARGGGATTTEPPGLVTAGPGATPAVVPAPVSRPAVATGAEPRFTG